MKHTQGLQFPLEDQTMLRTAKVHTLTMETGLALAKSFSTHRDLTSLSFIRRAQPVSRIDLSGGILGPGVQLQIFHLLDFSFIASLHFCRRDVRRSRHLRSLSESPGQRSAKLSR